MKFLPFLSVLAFYSSNALRLNYPNNHLGLTDEWNNFFSSFGNNNENSTTETPPNQGNQNFGIQPQQFQEPSQSQQSQIEGNDSNNNGSTPVVQPSSETEEWPAPENGIRLSVSPLVVPETPTLIN